MLRGQKWGILPVFRIELASLRGKKIASKAQALFGDFQSYAQVFFLNDKKRQEMTRNDEKSTRNE